MGPEDPIFAFMVIPGQQAVESAILARSVRDFGGGMAGNRIWAMVPQRPEAVSDSVRRELEAMDVKIISFPVDDKAIKFPLAAKVYAAAAAESLARENKAGSLAWLDSDNIIAGEPSGFRLAEGKALGCRPVMLRNISSPSGEPVDGFWQSVYEGCGTPAERIYSVTTTVDGVEIRAHFNAGMLVVRPERGLLGAWRDNFDRLYQSEALQPHYRKNYLYAVFVHQAVLAATVLSKLDRDEITELPDDYNYPLMLHNRIVPGKRAGRIDRLTTLRYDEYQEDPEWLRQLPQEGRIVEWLRQHFLER